MTPARGALVLVAWLVGLTAARAAEPPAAPLDAEMLRDLDVVASPTYTRDRELGKKLRVVERMRMLEGLRRMEADAPVPTAAPPTSSVPPTPPAPKEVK